VLTTPPFKQFLVTKPQKEAVEFLQEMENHGGGRGGGEIFSRVLNSIASFTATTLTLKFKYFNILKGPTQSPIQWVPAALFLEVMRPGREGDNSFPSSAEVKNAWSYTSTPQYAFML